MAAGVFAQDSSLMRFLTRIADLMILNLLFLVTLLPLVTIGAALTALNFTAMRIATGTDGPIVGDYLRSFRRNLRQATVLWLLVVVAGAALAAWHVVVTQSSLPSLATIALLAIWYLLLFMSVMTTLYVFPYLARFEGSIRELLRNARLMSIRHPLAPLVTIALGGLAAVVTIHYPQATAYGLLWLMIGFAGIAFLAGSLFARVFEKYAPTVPVADEEEEA